MKSNYVSEVQKMWKTIGTNRDPEQFQLELEFYKKVFDVFQIGKSYFLVFAPSIHTLEWISPGLKEVLGYDPKKFSIQMMLESIHPDDLPTFVEFENAVVDFKMKLPKEKLSKYKSMYNYRLRNHKGEYIKILQQSLTIQYDDEGAIIRNLAIHTDISDFKTDNEMKLSFIGLDGEPSYKNVKTQKVFSDENSILTAREKEILLMLISDKSTKEISELLFISPQTVKTHRKNIHAKLGTTNTLQLVLKAMDKGWI